MLRKLPRWCQENSLFPLLTEVSLLKTRFSLSQLNLNDGNDSLQMPCSRSSSRCSTRFGSLRNRAVLQAEILAVRHQLLVLQRSLARSEEIEAKMKRSLL
jgi:hypothetical protein